MRRRNHYGNFGFFLESDDFGRSRKGNGYVSHSNTLVRYDNTLAGQSEGEGWEPPSEKIECVGHKHTWIDFLSIGNFR